MKATSGAVYDTIRKDYMNTVVPLLLAEWNLNRYYNTVVDNTPAEDTDGYDVEMFPIESIVLPNRPVSGISKAVTDQATVDIQYHDSVPNNRYYVTSTDDIYKYWQSPYTTVAGSFSSNCQPQVTYQNSSNVNTLVTCNKIVVGIENSFAQPVNSLIQVQLTTGGSWTTVVTNPAIPSNGRVQVWYNGTNWTTTPDYTHTTQVAGVRYVVQTMNKTSVYFNLIELGAYLELDLSADLIEVSDSSSLGEPDFITPLGTVSTNTGNITLFNGTGKYTNNNPSSPLYNILDQNVKFSLSYVYQGKGTIQQFVLYSDTWNEELDQTTVDLVDYSKFLQEVKPPITLYENIPVQEAIWRICDSVGFNNYAVTAIDATAHSTIDTFWTTGEQTAWEIFQELSRGTQTGIYFDSAGKLQIKTREATFDSTKSATWTFRQNTLSGGTELADVVSVEDGDKYEANHVTVTYQPTGFSELTNGVYPMEVVWEPSGTVVLRGTALYRNLLIGDQFIYLTGPAAKTWPWTGMCQIEGEWISYQAKQYRYYNGSTRSVAWVKSLKEQQRLDAKSSAAYLHLNGYTGALLVQERGLYNTVEANHYVDINGWTTARKMNFSTVVSPTSGVIQNKTSSTVSLVSRKNMNNDDFIYMYRGNTINQGYYYMGTRMKIDKTGNTTKAAGIFFNCGTNLSDGYYLEMMPTSRVDKGNVRQTRNELIFYSQKSNGTRKRFGGQTVVVKDMSKTHAGGATTKVNTGAAMVVIEDQWVNLDIYFSASASNDHHIQIWANGRLLMDFLIDHTDTFWNAWNDKFGMFVRGSTSATFEYIYGIARNDIPYTDQEVFLDRITGGYIGDQWQRDWVYEKRTVRRKIRKKWTKVRQLYSQRYFDDFGPIVHEIREYDVKFNTDGLPVKNAKLLNSNENQAVCTDFAYDPSGARFTVANTLRRDVVLNGDDNLTSPGNTIGQKLLIYGRPLIQKDSATIERTDDFSIKRRSKIDIDYQSKWIQDEATATQFANWLTSHWSNSDAELTVEAWGNPLIELTDVVTLQYQNYVAGSNKFYITGIDTSFSDGSLSSTFTLREAT